RDYSQLIDLGGHDRLAASRCDCTKERMAWILERHSRPSVAGQRVADKAECMRDAGRDDDALWVGKRAASTREILGGLDSHVPEPGRPAVTQVGRCGAFQRVAHRAKPGLPRKLCDLRKLRPEVVEDFGGRARRPSCLRLETNGGSYRRCRTLAQGDVPR